MIGDFEFVLGWVAVDALVCGIGFGFGTPWCLLV